MPTRETIEPELFVQHGISNISHFRTHEVYELLVRGVQIEARHEEPELDDDVGHNQHGGEEHADEAAEQENADIGDREFMSEVEGKLRTSVKSQIVMLYGG